MNLECNTVVGSLSNTTSSQYPLDDKIQGEGDPYQLFQDDVKVKISSNYLLEARVLGDGDPYQLLREEVKVEHEENANKRVVRTVKLTNPWKGKNKNMEIPGTRKDTPTRSSSRPIVGENPNDHENIDDPDNPDDPGNIDNQNIVDQSETQHHVRPDHETMKQRLHKTNNKNALGKSKILYKTQEALSYSRLEDINILNFLIKGSFFKLTTSDMIWKHMKEQGLNPGRSWRGLKHRFLGNILKNLDKYGLTRQMIMMSDRTPMSEKVLLPKPLDGDGDVPKVMKSFSMEEDKKIIQYIIKNNKFAYIHGTKIWKEIERCVVVPNRSGESLKSRFTKVIYPNIEAFNLSESDLSKFKNIKETKLKVRLLNQNNKIINTNIDHTLATCSVNMEKELLNSKTKSLYQGPEKYEKQKSKYVCSICGYASTHESSAINHVTVHLKELKYSCSKCAFTAKTKDYMNNHIRKFTGETQKEYNHRIKQDQSK